MMTNLFSIFDPSTNMIMSLNWLSMITSMILMPMNFFIFPSNFNYMFMIILKLIINEFKLLINLKLMPNLIIFIGLLFMIMMNNLFSLFPYIFTSTSHMSINLSLSLSMWISFMFYGWLKNTNKMFIHLVPMNTPFMLMNFMVLIESISNIIRPWTLAIRLTANMLAGHLLLSLLGSTMMNFKLLMPIFMMTQNLLFMLEMSVALIQSYVFSILSLLYFNESN